MCADGHSYEKDFIQKWLARLDTSLVVYPCIRKIKIAFALSWNPCPVHVSRLGKRSSPKTNMSLPHTTLIPNVNLRNIIQSIRVRMPAIQSEQIKSIKEMQDLEAIVRSLMEDQGKLAVTCIDPTRSPESSPAAYCSSPNAPNAPNIPKLPPPDRASMEEPIPVLLSLLRHESKEVSERALGLIDALVAADPPAQRRSLASRWVFHSLSVCFGVVPRNSYNMPAHCCEPSLVAKQKRRWLLHGLGPSLCWWST